MTITEIADMTTAELRRHARRLVRSQNHGSATAQLERIQDIRQGAVTGRIEGWYRREIARQIAYAGRCRRLGLKWDARCHIREARTLRRSGLGRPLLCG